MTDEVEMGTNLEVVEVDLTPLLSFIFGYLHSCMNPVDFVLGDSFLKERRGKEALGCHQ